MLAASASFDTVVQGRVMTVAARLLLDLPPLAGIDLTTAFTRALKSINLDTQNQTDLPDAVRDAVGFSTIGGSCTLAGPIGPLRKETAAWLFNPDETDSPLYRQQIKGTAVTFDYGLYVPGSPAPEFVRKLTGRIAGPPEIDHAAGTVTLQLVDLSADWSKGTPEIPAVVTETPFNAGLTSEFPMDAVIRSVSTDGSSTWPAKRPQALLSVGMRSSIWPEQGLLRPDLSSPVGISFAAGKFGTALAHANDLIYELRDAANNPAAVQPADSVFVEFWAPLDAIESVTVKGGGTTRFTVATSPYQVRATITNASGSANYVHTVPANAAVHYVGALFTWAPGATSWTATIFYDGGIFPSGTLTAPAARSGTDTCNLVEVVLTDTAGTLEALQVTNETAPVDNSAFTPIAVLDPSLNPLTVCPPIAADTLAWDELQTMAAAELGYARFDELGVFRFSNRQTLASAAPVRDITSTQSLKTLTTGGSATSEYRRIRVPFTEWSFAPAAAVFVLDSVKKIPRRTVTRWTQPLPEGTVAAAIDTTALLLPNGHDPNDGQSWYRASSDVSGVNAHPGLTVTINQLTSNTVQITAINPSALDAYLTTPATYTDLTAGSASSGLWVGGVPAVAAAEQIAEVTIGDGAFPLPVSSNPYLQVQDAAVEVGYHLLRQLATPVRDFTNVAIIPDPRVQVADKLHLLDAVRSGVDDWATVWAWSLSMEFPSAGESGGSLDMTLGLRALGPPGAWLGGVAGRSEGGVTTYGY